MSDFEFGQEEIEGAGEQEIGDNEAYKEWYKIQKFQSVFSEEELTKEIQIELDALATMPVEEYTLLEKYQEIQKKWKTKSVTNIFGEVEKVSERNLSLEQTCKNNIWRPEHIDDYLKLEPQLILCNKNKKLIAIWNTIRTFTATTKNNNNIGRNLYYLVQDKVRLKWLGVICLSSDYLDVKGRDAYVKWTREQRNSGRINYTSVGSTIIPTQPLGYNYVGGKLLALLLLSDTVQIDWERLYGDKLIALTTTSLYGGFSQYSGLKYWKSMGLSQGSSTFRPSPILYEKLRQWIKSIEPRKFWVLYHAKNEKGSKLKRDHVNRFLQYTFRKLGFKQKEFITNHQRGIYFSILYTNAAEFLREDITEDKLIKRMDTSTDALVEVWKKLATKRINNLKKSNRINLETLFYDDMIPKDWDESKQKYLKQVGR